MLPCVVMLEKHLVGFQCNHLFGIKAALLRSVRQRFQGIFDIMANRPQKAVGFTSYILFLSLEWKICAVCCEKPSLFSPWLSPYFYNCLDYLFRHYYGVKINLCFLLQDSFSNDIYLLSTALDCSWGIAFIEYASTCEEAINIKERIRRRWIAYVIWKLIPLPHLIHFCFL